MSIRVDDEVVASIDFVAPDLRRTRARLTSAVQVMLRASRGVLSVVSGAELTFDITMDRAEISETLAAKLKGFRVHGGGTSGRKWHGAPRCRFTEGWEPPFGGSGCGRDERFRPHQVRWLIRIPIPA
ncbi:hypothetical protein OG894_03100 [Streptomyces sp. NBC_01724]|uniref:hypothetical protein n=1 Tax=unclassified Streptomyces TaxID=2593676 RepID=UPI002E376DE9|nr:hypothetical protein [Streptomyces sp. NBC_01724]WTE56264.1 hypothetical protein OG987_39605 [Streptomyces sp. NBC_01620]WTE64338.1 hypothetical protein OG784_39340 [Streptomyces sp. NBC_01617]WTI91623.1 hypothetical protein OHB17_38655 [Streptomyces sp. NBC_00724]